jgi:single-stranded DNA-binding protein
MNKVQIKGNLTKTPETKKVTNSKGEEFTFVRIQIGYNAGKESEFQTIEA